MACLFRVLNAFDASTSKTASHSLSVKISLAAWTAASAPACCPAQSWRLPTAFMVSSLAVFMIHLLIILLSTSPIPIGLTSFFCFLRGMSLLFISTSRCWQYLHPIICESSATALHKSAATMLFLLDDNSILHVLSSIPNSPGAPFISIAAFLTISWLMLRNVTWCVASISPDKSASWVALVPAGCFSFTFYVVSFVNLK